jgi:membrane associated rhomboid family serine protease
MNPYNRPGGRVSVFPPGVKILLIINVALYVLMFFFSIAPFNEFIYKYLYLWPLDGAEIGMQDFGFWQLLSYQFLHSPDIFHVLFNMFALWMFGSEIERYWGTNKFMVFYILSGIGAGIAQILIAPLFEQIGPTVGASGSIFGVLVAYALLFPNRPVFMFPIFIPIPAKYFVMGYAAINLLMAISGAESNVAWMAHLGGAATGFLLFKFGDQIGLYSFFAKLFKSKGQKMNNSGFDGPFSGAPEQDKVYNVHWSRPSAKAEKEEKKDISNQPFSVDGEEITQTRIDEILDKISESGYQNLTEKEKQILFELSQKLK